MSEKDEVNGTEEAEEQRDVDRRELLRAIGVALAAASTGGVVVNADAQTRGRTPVVVDAGNLRPVTSLEPPARFVQATRNVKLAADDGVYSVFYSQPKGKTAATVLVVNQSDQAGIQKISRELGGSPAIARVVNGVVQVELGRVAAGRCWINDVNARFNPRLDMRRLDVPNF